MQRKIIMITGSKGKGINYSNSTKGKGSTIQQKLPTKGGVKVKDMAIHQSKLSVLQPNIAVKVQSSVQERDESILRANVPNAQDASEATINGILEMSLTLLF